MLAVAARLYLRFIVHETPTYITTRTICRMDALTIGMSAACLYRSEVGSRWLAEHLGALRTVLVVAFAGVLWLFLYAYGSITLGVQTFDFSWITLFYAMVLLLAVQNRTGWLAGFLRNPLLRELGTVSLRISHPRRRQRQPARRNSPPLAAHLHPKRRPRHHSRHLPNLQHR